MKKPIQISLPNPCHENWDRMTLADKGKFCGACQKKVHDFTRASDREIVEAFKHDADLCGRYLVTQLERDLVIPKEKSNLWAAASAAAIALLAIAPPEAAAQTTEPIEQTESEIMLGKMIAPSLITGVVSDQEFPLPGANVSVEGTTRTTQTDIDGNYSIEAVNGQVLLFAFEGLVTERITVGTARTINVNLKEAEPVLEIMGLGVRPPRGSLTGSVTIISRDLFEAKEKNRTFFGRIFYSISNIFSRHE